MAIVYLLLGLFLLALVGHWLWFIGAAVVRELFGGPEAHKNLRCPRCDRPLKISEGRCVHCWLGVSIRAAAEWADLQALARLSTHLRRNAILDETALQQLRAFLGEREAEILH